MEIINSEIIHGFTRHHITPLNFGKITKNTAHLLNCSESLPGYPNIDILPYFKKFIHSLILRLHDHQDSPIAYWLKADTNPLIVALEELKNNIEGYSEKSILRSYKKFIQKNIDQKSNDIFWLLHAADLINFHSGWDSRFISMTNPKEQYECTSPYENLKLNLSLDKQDKTYWTNSYEARVWKGIIPNGLKIKVCFDGHFWEINENETFYAISHRCPESHGFNDFTNTLFYQDQEISQISTKWCPLHCTVIPNEMADNKYYCIPFNASIPQSWFQEFKQFDDENYSQVTDFSSQAQKIVNQLKKKSIKKPSHT